MLQLWSHSASRRGGSAHSSSGRQDLAGYHVVDRDHPALALLGEDDNTEAARVGLHRHHHPYCLRERVRGVVVDAIAKRDLAAQVLLEIRGRVEPFERLALTRRRVPPRGRTGSPWRRRTPRGCPRTTGPGPT